MDVRRLSSAAIGCTVFAAVFGLSVASSNGAEPQQGKPDGQGANACHLLYPGGLISPAPGGGVQIGGIKYNVGNPEQVLIAGDCDGGPISLIDDGLTLSVSSPSGSSGSYSQNFYNFCGGFNTGGPAVDVTSLFHPGTNSFDLNLDNDCGGNVFAPPLYLVVRQHAN